MQLDSYKLIEGIDNNFLIEKNQSIFWSTKFNFYWGVRYGFDAVDFDGNSLSLKGKNFFSRKLTLYKNGDVFAKFKREKCIFPFANIWLDGRKFIYDEEVYICSLDKVREKSCSGKVIYSWKIKNDSKYDWVVASIALLSIQTRASVAVTGY